MKGRGVEAEWWSWDELLGIFLVGAFRECFQKEAVCLGDPIIEAETPGSYERALGGDAMVVGGSRVVRRPSRVGHPTQPALR